jgi:glycosyltransferase involved in cell wall biosynthesis
LPSYNPTSFACQPNGADVRTTTNVPVRHILIPIHDFSAGGTELIAFRLARHWLAAGRRVSILAGASDGPLRPRVPEGVEVHVLSPERPRSPISRMFLGSQMAPDAAAIAPDAIFIPGNFHFVVGKGLRRALPKAAIVAKASNPVWSDDWVPLPIARRLVAFGTRGIDRIVAMAGALAPEVARFVKAERVVTIPDPFLDDDTIFPERPVPASGKSLDMLVVGRLEAQKDPQLAIAVAGALKAGGQDIQLTILGGGPMRDGLQAEIERAGLAEQVMLAGYVTDPAPYYRAADLLLMTSRFEGVPAAIGEALTHGLPFVATDCSSWLTALARENPTLGTVVGERQADALAAAVIARSKLPSPGAGQIEAGIGAHRAGPAARAYLDLFDSLI